MVQIGLLALLRLRNVFSLFLSLSVILFPSGVFTGRLVLLFFVWARRCKEWSTIKRKWHEQRERDTRVYMQEKLQASLGTWRLNEWRAYLLRFVDHRSCNIGYTIGSSRASMAFVLIETVFDLFQTWFWYLYSLRGVTLKESLASHRFLALGIDC